MPLLYAIAASLPRARFFLEAGAPVVQLRIKDAPLAPHAAEIRAWPERFPASRVVVNDDLDFALSVGAWGVHLGQEDVRRYPQERIGPSCYHVAAMASIHAYRGEREAASAQREEAQAVMTSISGPVERWNRFQHY